MKRVTRWQNKRCLLEFVKKNEIVFRQQFSKTFSNIIFLTNKSHTYMRKKDQNWKRMSEISVFPYESKLLHLKCSKRLFNLFICNVKLLIDNSSKMLWNRESVWNGPWSAYTRRREHQTLLPAEENRGDTELTGGLLSDSLDISTSLSPTQTRDQLHVTIRKWPAIRHHPGSFVVDLVIFFKKNWFPLHREFVFHLSSTYIIKHNAFNCICGLKYQYSTAEILVIPLITII